MTGLLLSACNDLEREENWKEGHGNLQARVGSKDVQEKIDFAPAYRDFADFKEYIGKTDYEEPTGKWFDGSTLGYGIASGTMKSEDSYEVILFGHDPDGVDVDQDMRIQLTEIGANYQAKKLIDEDIVHIETISGEEEVYANTLPDRENVTYLLSAELLGEDGEVEDTLLGIIYVPEQEVNAELLLDHDVYHVGDEATLTLKNYGPAFFSFGKVYTLEKKVNDTWREVLFDEAFEDIGIHLSPGETYDQQVSLDELSEGMYRIVKEFYVEGLDDTVILGEEFTLED